MIALSTRRIFWDLIKKLEHLMMHDVDHQQHPTVAWFKTITKTSEARLFVYVISLYAIFITWGYLQEKLTTVEYTLNDDTTRKWESPLVLNFLMNLFAGLTASFVRMVSTSSFATSGKPFRIFWKASLAAALASPIGYFSLNYIPYPMMILSKSSKQVPVMIIGKVWYHRQYEWFKYASVCMVCIGIGMFTIGKSLLAHSTIHETMTNASPTSLASPVETSTTFYATYGKSLIGLVLIILNLGFDGITNNEQDALFRKHDVTSIEMMESMNYWQCVYMGMYLCLDTITTGHQSLVYRSLLMFFHSYHIQYEIFLFCLCAAVGQVLLYQVIKEFGSLVWITVSVTRQLFTIILSVVLFNHRLHGLQWFGIVFVFAGLGLEMGCNYLSHHPDFQRVLQQQHGWQWLQAYFPVPLTATAAAMSPTKRTKQLQVEVNGEMDREDVEQNSPKQKDMMIGVHSSSSSTRTTSSTSSFFSALFSPAKSKKE